MMTGKQNTEDGIREMGSESTPILALDPGKDKCGVAVVTRADGATRVLRRQVIAASNLEAVVPEWIAEFRIEKIVLGDATTSRAWHARLSTLLPSIEVIVVKETNSTLEARALYWKHNPPRGWRRVLPLSLQVPPEPIDDFAAIVLAERFFSD